MGAHVWVWLLSENIIEPRNFSRMQLRTFVGAAAQVWVWLPSENIKEPIAASWLNQHRGINNTINGWNSPYLWKNVDPNLLTVCPFNKLEVNVAEIFYDLLKDLPSPNNCIGGDFMVKFNAYLWWDCVIVFLERIAHFHIMNDQGMEWKSFVCCRLDWLYTWRISFYVVFIWISVVFNEQCSSRHLDLKQRGICL